PFGREELKFLFPPLSSRGGLGRGCNNVTACLLNFFDYF
ncbi:MAG: hypothetical protein ACI8Q3_002568, partial [Marinomonas primoryensis]